MSIPQSLSKVLDHPDFQTLSRGKEDEADAASTHYWWVTDSQGTEHAGKTLEAACSKFLRENN